MAVTTLWGGGGGGEEEGGSSRQEREREREGEHCHVVNSRRTTSREWYEWPMTTQLHIPMLTQCSYAAVHANTCAMVVGGQPVHGGWWLTSAWRPIQTEYNVTIISMQLNCEGKHLCHLSGGLLNFESVHVKQTIS